MTILKVIQTMSSVGLVAQTDDSLSMTLDLKSVTAEEALHILAHTFELTLVRDLSGADGKPVYSLSHPHTPARVSPPGNDVAQERNPISPPKLGEEGLASPPRKMAPPSVHGGAIPPTPLYAESGIPPPAPAIEAPENLPENLPESGNIVTRQDPPASPGQPPVALSVTAITSSDGKSAAVIEYLGQSYIVEKGSRIPPSTPDYDLEIKSINQDWVVVYDRKSNRIMRRRVGY